jgi:hypothetical protein
MRLNQSKYWTVGWSDLLDRISQISMNIGHVWFTNRAYYNDMLTCMKYVNLWLFGPLQCDVTKYRSPYIYSHLQALFFLSGSCSYGTKKIASLSTQWKLQTGVTFNRPRWYLKWKLTCQAEVLVKVGLVSLLKSVGAYSRVEGDDVNNATVTFRMVVVLTARHRRHWTSFSDRHC